MILHLLPMGKFTQNEFKFIPTRFTSHRDVLPSATPVRLFGQFKQNGFGFNNLSSSSPSTFGQTASKDKTDDNGTPTTYFTNTLAKISSTITSGFGSSSTPLAASLATLGAKYEFCSQNNCLTVIFSLQQTIIRWFKCYNSKFVYRSESYIIKFFTN